MSVTRVKVIAEPAVASKYTTPVTNLVPGTLVMFDGSGDRVCNLVYMVCGPIMNGPMTRVVGLGECIWADHSPSELCVVVGMLSIDSSTINTLKRNAGM